jgi:shikimate dehydrogenase
MVLGAGGSARAVVWALLDAGAAEVRLWNRTAQRARDIAAELGATVAASPGPADLLVNCTAVGLDGSDPFDQLGLAPGDLAAYECVVDLVYTATGTVLVDRAREQGVTAVGGLELLIGQGALSFEIFTGVPASLEAMRAAATPAQSSG